MLGDKRQVNLLEKSGQVKIAPKAVEGVSRPVMRTDCSVHYDGEKVVDSNQDPPEHADAL